jgi:hypothetical protein
MNARKLINGTLTTLLFAWSMAATLPALNNEVLSPFEAFVLTPVLLMLASVGALAAYRGLERLEQRLSQALAARARRASEAGNIAGLGNCLLGSHR